MIKIMTIFGTRPEAIKMLPLIKEFEKKRSEFKNTTVITGQHKEMLTQVLETFDVKPDYDLKIMSHNQTITSITIKIIDEIGKILQVEKPDMVLVHGDTTTSFAASLAAFYHKIPIGHVEAGLRTWDKYNPFPEEMNRQLTDTLSDLFFAPTIQSKKNLLAENKDSDKIFVTGNTVIDALKYSIIPNFKHPILKEIGLNRKIILLTMHRRENQGEPMKRVFVAIRKLVERNKDIDVIFPVHLSPTVQQIAKEYIGDAPGVHLTEPLNMIDFHNIASKSYMILTDSGGVQEEAPSLHKPVLVLRNETERPEGVSAGTLKIVGTQTDKIISEVEKLLTDKYTYDQMAEAENPYGDGRASERILSIIRSYFKNN